MKPRKIPLELDILCEGQEAEDILKINKSPELTGHALESDDEPSSSHESPDDEFPVDRTRHRQGVHFLQPLCLSVLEFDSGAYAGRIAGILNGPRLSIAGVLSLPQSRSIFFQ